MQHLERCLQIQIVNFLRAYYRNKLLVYSIPNGGSRNSLEAKNLKKEGMLSGVADLHIISKNKILFIELKVGKNKQSETQKEFQKIVENYGFKYFVVRSLDELLEILKKEQVI